MLSKDNFRIRLEFWVKMLTEPRIINCPPEKYNYVIWILGLKELRLLAVGGNCFSKFVTWGDSLSKKNGVFWEIVIDKWKSHEE